MGTICEHELKDGTEYDLYARLGLTLAYQKIKKKFVIKRIKDDKIEYAFDKLEEAVRKCNELEGAENTKIKCGWLCERKNNSKC